MAEADVIKIFFGREDTPELTRMAKKAERKGFKAFGEVKEPEALRYLRSLYGRTAMLAGGSSDICLAEGIDIAALQQPKKIRVNLWDVRTGRREHTDSVKALKERALGAARWLRLYGSMPIENMPLKVYPPEIWEEALKDTRHLVRFNTQIGALQRAEQAMRDQADQEMGILYYGNS